jgi:hypothetical protein
VHIKNFISPPQATADATKRPKAKATKLHCMSMEESVEVLEAKEAEKVKKIK